MSRLYMDIVNVSGGIQVFTNSIENDVIFYSESNSQSVHIGCTSNAPSMLKLSQSNVCFNGPLLMNSNDSSNAPGFSWNGDSNTGLYHAAKNVIGFVSGGNLVATMSNTTATFSNVTASNVTANATSSTLTTPSYSWQTDTDTGMYRVADNTIGFSCGGSNVMSLSNNSLTMGSLSSPGYLSAGNLGMFRNRIINGDMRIAQRGTSFSYTSATIKPYTLDRFLSGIFSGTGTIVTIQNTLSTIDAPYQYGFRYSIKATVTGVTTYGDVSTFSQCIENYNLTDLNWGTIYGQPITVSFWFKAKVSGQYSLAIRNGNASNLWYGYATLFAITSSDTWQFVTVTVPPPPSTYTWNMNNNTSLTGIQLFIGTNSSNNQSTPGTWVSSPSQMATGATIWMTTNNNYIEMTGLQLEKGSIATPFEFRPQSIELQLCQRYYEVIKVRATLADEAVISIYTSSGAGNAAFMTNFKTVKRADAEPTYLLNSIVMAAGVGGDVSLSCDDSMLTFRLSWTAITGWVFPKISNSALSCIIGINAEF